MKALTYISASLLLTLGSCSSSLYTGAEYDDLYYLASDKPVVKAKAPANERITAGSLKQGEYYDNIYAADTLVSDQYSDAIKSDTLFYDNNNNGGGYEYYDNYSYTGRLNRFYGNYFNPYWRDPFYSDYSYGYPSFGYGYNYGGYNNFYNPFMFNPSYGYGGYYDNYYGGMYGGYGGMYGGYGGMYGGYGGMYGGYGGMYGGYGPFSSPFGYSGNYYHNEGKNSIPYGRTERPSSLSSKWNSSISPTGTSRRDSYISSDAGRRQAVNQTARTATQNTTKGENIRTNSNTQRNSANARPEYNSANRSYTPSYSSPRMSTRPSYNNSRVSDGINTENSRTGGAFNSNRVNSNVGAVRTQPNQGSYQNPYNPGTNNSSVNNVQRRVVSPSGYSSPASISRPSSSGSSGNYSVPTRRSVESSNSYNNSSGGRSSSSYNGGSSSSSYSGGSSGSSYSSGSSSGGSSSGGSSSGGSSSGSSNSSSGTSSGGSGRR
jgi:hypothetical protein